MNAEALHNKTLGQQGEALAADYLVAKGYCILERNYRAGHQELDLITRQDDILHFVEVKTREATQFGLGEDAMHKWKFERLLQAIDAYLASFEEEPEWQLDLIVVELKAKSVPQFIHYEAVGPINAS
jgi:putative endonuclease